MEYKDDIKAKERRKRFYYRHREQAVKETAEWRKTHKEQRNKTERVRNAARRRTDPEFREKERQRSARAYAQYREKRLALAKKHRGTEAAQARQAVQNAIRKGELTKPKHCHKCPSTLNLQAHHPDYSKPLDVEWLCVFCHGEAHQLP